MTAIAPDQPPAATAWLRNAFCFAVLAFVWWRISGNTADNDLWGHVLYGQRLLHVGGLETMETLSWTAAGRPWINHEVLAELALGLTHRIAGGAGLWLLMVAMAGITIGIAWRAGAGVDARQRLLALVLLGLSGDFITMGFAARPQLFTYLFFVLLLLALRRLFATGFMLWAAVPPLLLVVWANTHGGFLAGWLIVIMAVALEIFGAFFPAFLQRYRCEPSRLKPLPLVNIALVSTLALAANPWGWQLVTWTFATLRLPRPTITEWQPMPLAWWSLPFFATVALGALAWVGSRRPRRLWEMAAWGLLAAATFQHQRHAPLFGLASLVFLPPHILDLLARFSRPPSAPASAKWRSLAAGTGTAALALAGGTCLWASLTPTLRPHPWRMTVPRDRFPVSAIAYMREQRVTGNTITFFNWGQQVLWELPDNPVSFDGRLDTVYPAEIMDAHWRLYAGADPGPALRIGNAACALLPTGSGGVGFLYQLGWSVVYQDPLATVLIRPRALLHDFSAPIEGGAEAVAGSIPFPDAPPALATTVDPTIAP